MRGAWNRPQSARRRGRCHRRVLHRWGRELRGFGSFRLRERGARMGRNPKTGVKVSVPAKKIPYFKPGKELKELINR